MASIPRPADPLKKWRVTITDKRGKNPTVLNVDWLATTQKEARRAVIAFILGGKFDVQEVKKLGLS